MASANKDQTSQFSFEISLSVLNHLGRNLYRSFMTVLGEAISNAWDADAKNVWIEINKEDNFLVVKDDGDGMDDSDFQDKFLKIGYSKRKSGKSKTRKGRPFIGRKGIGKLALLSCAKKISVLTKKHNGSYIGGVIDNSDLDKAIKNDLTPDQYLLEEPDQQLLESYQENHEQGTIIYFEDINEGIRNSTDYLKKLIALYYRFSLLDDSFNIYVNEEKITLAHLNDLAVKTQFLWRINGIDDPYISNLQNLKHPMKDLSCALPIKGFIASVVKPRHLKIDSTEEKIGVDLFVNGRLREKDILKHIPTARIVESYLYGQIHFDELDKGNIDRFTSSREGIVAEDSKFKDMLETLRTIIMPEIIEDWDIWRIELAQDGDPDNPRMNKKERRSRELFNAVAEDYSLSEESEEKKKVETWVKGLANDAQFNFAAYAECFISENLIRKYICDKSIPLSPEAHGVIGKWRKKVVADMLNGKLSIDIRQADDDLSFLAMDNLAYLVDNKKGTDEPCLARDADVYKPIRDALMHTSLLTTEAKTRLTATYDNIKGRLRFLLTV
jgi:hypothetical protein